MSTRSPRRNRRPRTVANGNPVTNVASEYNQWLKQLPGLLKNNINADFYQADVDELYEERLDEVEKSVDIGIHHLPQLVSKYFYDPHIMSIVRSRLLKEKDLDRSDRTLMSTTVMGMYRIGEESVNGVVYLAGTPNDDDYNNYLDDLIDKFYSAKHKSYTSVEDKVYKTAKAVQEVKSVTKHAMFAVKTPIFHLGYSAKEITKGVMHEYFVGLEANSLRNKHCPYYVYTYEYVECNTPVFFDKNFLSGCVVNNGKTDTKDIHKSTYIITEAIDGPPISMFKYYNTVNYDDFVITFTLMVNGMMVAWNELGFIHGDLHGDNVLIRDPTKKYALPLHHKGKVLYMEGHTPVVIDLGAASTTKNPWYSSEGSPQSTPVHDLIRLLLFLTTFAPKHDKNIYVFCMDVLDYCTLGLKKPGKTEEKRISPNTLVHRTIADVNNYIISKYNILSRTSNVTEPASANIKAEYRLTHERHFTIEELILNPSLQKEHKADTIANETVIINKISSILNSLRVIFYESFDLWEETEDIYVAEYTVNYGAMINRLYTDLVVRKDLLGRLNINVEIRGVTQAQIEDIRDSCEMIHRGRLVSYRAVTAKQFNEKKMMVRDKIKSVGQRE